MGREVNLKNLKDWEWHHGRKKVPTVIQVECGSHGTCTVVLATRMALRKPTTNVVSMFGNHCNLKTKQAF